MSDQMNIAGAGGGKGGGSPRQAIEAPDSLRSAQYANIVEVISEGEIEGLVDGMRSIYLEDTPVESSSGARNFEGADFIFYKGSQVQGTTGVQIGTGGVQNTTQVGVEVTVDTPVTRTITNSEIDWVKVVIGVPQLTRQDMSNGDIHGTEVTYEILLQSNAGGFVSKVSGIINGKTNSYYKREHKIMLTGQGPWDIRVKRLTPDSTSSALQNKTFWSEMIEGIDVKLSYPNTAVCGLRVNSEQFRSVPKRGYHIRGLRIKVPSNYDPLTRIYTGAWDGTFKIAWSDNPAWCFFDLLTNARYGLGGHVDPGQVDKWSLYQIGKYCDELVPDGFGGTEPRFTCNLYLQNQEDAFKVINSMASIFRGMVYYADGEILFSQDAPKDAVAVFAPSNVIEGMFTYQGADRRARHTVALVSWNDPEDMYRQKIEYVSDSEGIARWGVVQTELLAVGCTSRGQAHRMGKWLLFTEQHESETVTFRAAMDAARCAPGEVIKIQDPVRSGRRWGGRIVSSTPSSLVLDAPIEIQSGIEHTVSFMLADGTLHDAVVTSEPGPAVSSITFSPAPSVQPVDGAMWVVSSPALVAEQWRVISVAEVEPSIVEINALYYNPGKFASVEQGITLEASPTSAIRSRPGPVTNLNASNEVYRLNDVSFSTKIALSWTAPETAVSYVVTWRREQENERIQETRIPGLDIENVPAGTYTIKVAAKNNLGISGQQVVITHEVSSSGVAPDVQNIRLSPNFSGRDMPVIWDAVAGAYEYTVEIRSGAELLRQERVSENFYTYTYTKNLHDGGVSGPRRELTVRVSAKTLAGTSANWQSATFSNPAPAAPLGLQLEAGPGQVGVLAIRPSDEDLQGMIVWMSTSPGFTPGELTKVYQGTDNAFMKTGLQPGLPHYFRAAFYDAFGTTGLILSSEVMAVPTATGGVLTVESLPLSPEDVGGELAVFLDVPDTETRGLYGWNGSEWVSTSRILNGSVTTEKLASGAVDYTKLAAGAVQARNLAVKKHFLY
jgi:predicted phage tail protein